MTSWDIRHWVAPCLLGLVLVLVSGCTGDQAGGEEAAPDSTGTEFPTADTAENADANEPLDEDAGQTTGEEDAGTSVAEDTGTSVEDDAGTIEEPDIDEIVDVCADQGCDALIPPEGGCVEAFECDPDFTDEEGSHCAPVYRADGSPCLGSLDDKDVQVVGASGLATDTEASVCDRFVCHAEAETPPECVLASTLPTLIQVAMEIEGFFINHECALADMPPSVSKECNDWVCGCATEDCLDAQCQAIPDGAMLDQPCEALDMCWTGTCTALSDQPYMCVQHPVDCPVVSEAWCAEVPACDPATGCPVAMDEALSNAKCGSDDPCLISAVCDPENPEADATTGCVVAYNDPESGCGETIVGMSAGGAHSFALQADGTLHWWGTKIYAEPPEGVLFKQVSGGKSHTCAIDLDNNLHCWGISDAGGWDFGQVTLTPSQGKFTYAAAGYNHSCAIRDDGAAFCWGIGSEDNLTEDQQNYEKGQVTLTPTEPVFRQIGAGHGHTCGLKKDGSLECWGATSGVVDVPTGSDFVSLAVGFHHNCALDSGGALTCWGWIKFGLVEDVPEGTFLSVSCGYGHTCAVRTTGEVVCWGVPDKSEGAPQVVDSGQSTGAPLEPDFKLVGVNNSHSCAVTKDDKVTCWGSNGGNKSTPPVELQP